MTRFESGRSLELWALVQGREVLERIGRTPSHDGGGIPVPEDRPWGVDLRVLPHIEEADTPRLIEDLRAAGASGLRLESVDDGWLSRLTGMELRTLVVEDAAALTDAGLESIARMTGLRRLDLGKARGITDAGLSRLGALPALETLRLSEARQVTAAGVAAMNGWPALRRLGWRGYRKADETVRAIASLERLEGLDLAHSQVTDAGLEPVGRLTGLQALDLTATAVTDDGMKWLAALPRLERLDLRECEVGDEGLTAVGRIVSLLDLDLCDTAVLDEGLAGLAGLTELRALRLSRCGVRGDGLVALSGLRRLATLELTAGRLVADAGLREISRLEGLVDLGLAHCRGTLPEKGGVTDATLVHLTELPRLSRVDVTGCWVTALGVHALRGARPGIRVIAEERGVPAEIAHALSEAEGLRERGEHDDARTLLRRSVTEDPESVEAWTELGTVCAELGDTAGMEEAFTRAVDLSDDASAYQARGSARARLGNRIGAIADLSAALERDPEAGEVWTARGDLRFDSGDPRGAAGDYSRALALLCAGKGPPKVWMSVAPMLFVNRAAARLDMAEVDAALRDCDRALAIAPDNAIAHTNRGEARLRKRDAAGALADYERALALDPDAVEPYRGRGRSLMALGRNEEAARDLKRFLELAPDHPERAAVEGDLTQLRRK